MPPLAPRPHTLRRIGGQRGPDPADTSTDRLAAKPKRERDYHEQV